jgi:hypothetical protein
MFRRDLLIAWMTCPLAGWLSSRLSRAFGGTAIDGPNAALVYRRAFDWSESLGPGDLAFLREVAGVPIDDPRVEDLIRRAGPALQAIREAASIGRCRWDSQDTTPENLTKGHLSVFHLNVIRVACLSARRHAKLKRGREALDDVFAGLTLAHRVGTGGVSFARLLECSGEVAAFQTLGLVLPELDRASLDDLSRRLRVLPAPEPASATIGPESQFILSFVRTKIKAVGPTIEGPEWGEIGFDDDEAASLARLTGGDRSRLLAHLEANGPAFDELARRLDLPRPTCRTAIDEFAKSESSIHPIVAGLVDAAWGVRHVVDRMRALRSMMHAGLVLVLVRDGEAAFRAETDPFGTEGFMLERRGEGYLIRSAMKDEGKPEVNLQIGDMT